MLVSISAMHYGRSPVPYRHLRILLYYKQIIVTEELIKELGGRKVYKDAKIPLRKSKFYFFSFFFVTGVQMSVFSHCLRCLWFTYSPATYISALLKYAGLFLESNLSFSL